MRLFSRPVVLLFLLCTFACGKIPDVPTGLDGTVDATGRIAYTGISDNVRLSIFLAGEEGQARQPIVADQADFDDPAFSPDGRSIAVASNGFGDWDIHLVDLGSLSVRRLTEGAFTDLAPSFSPDGTRIAFQRRLEGDLDWEIFVVNLDGSGLTNLTESPGRDAHPAWSPDGSSIAYESGERLDQEIWLIAPDGGNRRRLTEQRPGMSGAPAWSPDGTRIAFESSEHQGDVAPTIFVEYDLYTVDVSGDNRSRYGELSGFGIAARSPAWSPDGSRIAFEVRQVGGTFGASRYRIWILDTVTDSLRQLPTGGTARKPDWSPLTGP